MKAKTSRAKSPLRDNIVTIAAGAKTERTCVGCRRRRPKAEMLRVCKRKDGAVFVDSSGKSPGRGCYVCPDGDCISEAGLKGGIARGLRSDVPESVYEELEGFANRGGNDGPGSSAERRGDTF